MTNYTEADEAILREAATEDNPLNAERAGELATQLGKSRRSVIAKAVRMELPYQNKVAETKDGQPIENKASIVAEIGQFLNANMDGLEKAPKVALQTIRNALRG